MKGRDDMENVKKKNEMRNKKVQQLFKRNTPKKKEKKKRYETR